VLATPEDEDALMASFGMRSTNVSFGIQQERNIAAKVFVTQALIGSAFLPCRVQDELFGNENMRLVRSSVSTPHTCQMGYVFTMKRSALAAVSRSIAKGFADANSCFQLYDPNDP
jgi:hypothetical protein